MSHFPTPPSDILALIRKGVAIPAYPLALNSKRKFDEKRARALARYYIAAGAGGIAVGVHSTQFEIREPKHNLLKPVLELAMSEMRQAGKPLVKVSGVCGPTAQAVKEAELAVSLGYDAGLLSLAAMKKADDDELIEHCRSVAKVMPIIGFYLQPSVGGRLLGVSFWRKFAEIPNIVAIKMAPFNRFQTIDVVRAVAEADRALTSKGGIALYTGNDDNIVADLLGTWTFNVGGKSVTQTIVGGLLGHWAYWTKRAVELLQRCQKINKTASVPQEMLTINRQVTDMNAAVFDPAHDYHGCIPGMHYALQRVGLLEGTWCLNPKEVLSPGQQDEIERVCKAYPNLTDDEFVKEHVDTWLK